MAAVFSSIGQVTMNNHCPIGVTVNLDGNTSVDAEQVSHELFALRLVICAVPRVISGPALISLRSDSPRYSWMLCQS
jgi:hypothetical protein